ncbi:MAG: tyrosine-type recombinase/integrase [Longimicrobiales bacterium]
MQSRSVAQQVDTEASLGLRLEECLRLRIKDIDFELRQILIRDGKGQKDRCLPLSRRAAELLRVQHSFATETLRGGAIFALCST